MDRRTGSNQPPQSSHMMKIAVEFQNVLCPIALTTLATQAGPLVALSG